MQKTLLLPDQQLWSVHVRVWGRGSVGVYVGVLGGRGSLSMSLAIHRVMTSSEISVYIKNDLWSRFLHIKSFFTSEIIPRNSQSLGSITLKRIMTKGSESCKPHPPWLARLAQTQGSDHWKHYYMLSHNILHVLCCVNIFYKSSVLVLFNIPSPGDGVLSCPFCCHALHILYVNKN